MENEGKTLIFSTRDLYLAVTLITMKFVMLSIDYQIEGDRNMPVGYFNFEDTDGLRETERKYRQGELLVEPKAFITNLRTLKSEINNIYKGPRTDLTSMKRA